MGKVIIADGGTVGLSAAVFLRRQGVDVTVLERRRQLSPHPRALGLAPRTLELFRQAGLSQAIDAAAVRSPGPGRISARTVAEIDRGPMGSSPPAPHDQSPEHPSGLYPQNRLDSVLLPAARHLGAIVELGVQVDGVSRDDGGVEVQTADGRRHTADFLVAADGVNSLTRAAVGVSTTGPGEIGNPTLNVLFDADLEGRFGPLPVMTDLTHPQAAGLLLAVGDGRWVLHTKPPQGGWTEASCLATIRTLLGADVPVELVSVLPWRATVRMADRFRSGRVLLVGDAARAVSPLGAFGLNTGIADAHNLAWKLAMVLAGTAGDPLLDTYHDERHAVAELVTEQTRLRWANPRLHWDRSAAAERSEVGAWRAPLVTMAYRYDSAAVIGPVPGLPSTEDLAACLDGSPGSRLPHRWIGPGVSTLDRVGPGFVLFTAGTDWDAAAAGLALTVVHLDPDWPATVGLASHGALLVRPDGFIAWRSVRPAPAELATVLARVTGRG